jgi:hypothetical protein
VIDPAYWFGTGQDLMELRRLPEEIASVARSRVIGYLLHFTCTANLASILQFGLVPRSQLPKKVAQFTINDALRWDGRQDYNCTSIAFPNAPMLYSFMQRDANIKWPIAVLSPSLLVEKDVLFCKHNAADKRISVQTSDELGSIDAFRGMFAEIGGHASRADQSLKSCDPTDVQAEVLIRGVIEPKYITSVVFPDEATSTEFKYKMGTRQSIVHGRNGLYGTRIYYRKWGLGR